MTLNNNIVLARFLMLILAFLISITGVLTKSLINIFPLWEVMFFNGLTCVTISFSVILIKGLHNLKVSKPYLHLFRVSSMVGAITCYVISLKFFFIIEVMAIYNFSPILVSLLAILILKEKFNIFRIGAILLGFIGVIFIIQPGTSIFSIKSFIPFVGASFVALAYISTRSIMKIDNVYATVFYYSLGVLFTAIIFFPNDFIIPNAYYCIGLLMVGVISVTSHYLFALATKYAEVSSIAPIEYTAFIWTGLLGYFFLKEIPSIMIILGGIIIISSGIYLVYVENKSIYPIS